MNKKILIFLRHNNDIDQITPVIWKLNKQSQIAIIVVISNTPKILNDYRISLLKNLDNVSIFLIADLLKKFLSKNTNESSFAIPTSNSPDKYYNEVFPAHRNISEYERFSKFILSELMEDTDSSLIVFDWISDNMTGYYSFAKSLCDLARNNALITISLPHGDEPHFCKMIRKKEITPSSSNIYKKAQELFDYLVVPNQLCAERYINQFPAKNLKILGSPRYNDEWISMNRDLMPELQSLNTSDTLNIVFFLRPFAYPVFWEEVGYTIKMITQFKGVHLTVIHHPRESNTQQYLEWYPDLLPRKEKNLNIISPEVPSSFLIHDADVVLDIGTSAVFEAIKLNKPVLEMEYLHATYTTISHYMPACVMMCRDHLYETLNSFLKDGCSNFYNAIEKEHFVKEVIDGKDSHVLDRYVKFMTSLLNKINQKSLK